MEDNIEFFLNKGKWLHERFLRIIEEMTDRGM